MKAQCKQHVFSGERSDFGGHRCMKIVWKDGYCKVHHPESVKIRGDKADERWEIKQMNSPWKKLTAAENRVKELEREIEYCKDKVRELENRTL